jgi:glycosyltransferase involved in cell wall biosynthesis
VGEHLDVYPSKAGLADFVRKLLKDPERLSRLAARGPAIVDHLHQPAMRAAAILQGLWPRERVLSGRDHQSRVSVLVTCHRYLRRFRVCLESLARQNLPPGSIEIVVADPDSPDGLAMALEEFAARYPGLRVVHLPLDARYHRNRGIGINRAFDASIGQVVIGIDGDLVFPPGLLGLLEERVLKNPDRVFGVRRIFIGKDDTERILRGDLDPFAEFDALSRSEGDGEEKSFVGVLGYCQAVDRKAFALARYPEEFDVVNQSDIVFVERLAREAQVSPQYLQDQSVLHLWHPRNWMGTSELL